MHKAQLSQTVHVISFQVGYFTNTTGIASIQVAQFSQMTMFPLPRKRLWNKKCRLETAVKVRIEYTRAVKHLFPRVNTKFSYMLHWTTRHYERLYPREMNDICWDLGWLSFVKRVPPRHREFYHTGHTGTQMAFFCSDAITSFICWCISARFPPWITAVK